MRVENVFNRMILYKANLVHCGTGYFGRSYVRNDSQLYFLDDRGLAHLN